MEALLFMFNSLAIVLMAYMGLRDDRRAPGAPHTSIFRMRDHAPAATTATAEAETWASWEQSTQERVP